MEKGPNADQHKSLVAEAEAELAAEGRDSGSEKFNSAAAEAELDATRLQQDAKKQVQAIAEARSQQTMDGLNILASLMCCLPSYVVTFCHCCCVAKVGVQDLSAICCSDLDFTPGNECGTDTEAPCFPGVTSSRVGFFCKPCNTIQDACSDYNKQNGIIAVAQAELAPTQMMRMDRG